MDERFGEGDILDDDDLFGIFDSLAEFPPTVTVTTYNNEQLDVVVASPKDKKRKVDEEEDGEEERISHIAVERNRRKQMNDHLSVLRSLMPSFYVKRGDQASIIGGVIEYINELQQVVQSLEAKKQRKFCNEVLLSPKILTSSPLISPRKPPISPRIPPPISPRLVVNIPISPTTSISQPTSPYSSIPMWFQQPRLFQPYSPTSSSSSSSKTSIENELVTNSKSAVADVEIKFCGPNIVMNTVSSRIRGQCLKIISAIEEHLSLEILHLNINNVDNDTMLNSFTIRIGIECKLSAEELAEQIQQTFT